jgi:surface protein
MSIVITDENINQLVRTYFTNKNSLPEDMRNISDWKVSNVKNMSYLFYNRKGFNEDINEWDVSNVETMECMFLSCDKFDKPLYKWNVSKVKTMDHMFSGCKLFNQPLNYNPDTGAWNVSKVENMAGMFFRCEKFNQDLSSWDVSNVTNMRSMFTICKSLAKKPNWLINETTDVEYIFNGTPLQGQTLRTINIKEADQDIRTINELFKYKFQNTPTDVVRYGIIPFIDTK